MPLMNYHRHSVSRCYGYTQSMFMYHVGKHGRFSPFTKRICVTVRYLYKYIESLKQEMIKDQADPRARRSALTVMCRAARRPGYFIWNAFSVTVSNEVKDERYIPKPASFPQALLSHSDIMLLAAVPDLFPVICDVCRLTWVSPKSPAALLHASVNCCCLQVRRQSKPA